MLKLMTIRNAVFPLLLSMLCYMTRAQHNVRLEPLCSNNSAGVTWTAMDHYTNGKLLLEFNCINPTNGVSYTSDDCFHKRGGLPFLSHLRDAFSSSMTHVLSQSLEPGTVCTFTVEALSRYEELLEEFTVNCTVGGLTALPVLPAACTSHDGACECSCSPGYEGEAGNIIDGNVCTLSPTTSTQFQTTTTIEPTSAIPEPTSTIFYTSNGASTSLHTPEQSSNVTTAKKSSSVEVSNTQPLETMFTSIPPTQSNEVRVVTSTTPDLKETPTLSVPSSAQEEMTSTVLLLMVSGVTAAVLAIGISLLLIVIVGVLRSKQRRRMKRFHEMMTMPFEYQRNEKIDPDFYPPITIDKMVPLCESMESVFQPLASAPQTVTDIKQTISEVKLKSSLTISDDENVGIAVSKGSSGYITESLISNTSEISSMYITESLISQVNEYITSIDENDTTIVTSSPKVFVTYNEAARHQSALPLDASHKCELEIHPQESNYIHEVSEYVENEDGYVVQIHDMKETGGTSEQRPADYEIPSSLKDVSFYFPRDMNQN